MWTCIGLVLMGLIMLICTINWPEFKKGLKNPNKVMLWININVVFATVATSYWWADYASMCEYQNQILFAQNQIYKETVKKSLEFSDNIIIMRTMLSQLKPNLSVSP